MRVEIIKGMKRKHIEILKMILAFEDKYGENTYYSKISSNNIAWRVEDLPTGISHKDISFLVRQGIIEVIRKGVYHIRPTLREKLRNELMYVDEELGGKVDIDNALRYAVKNNEDAYAILELIKFQRKWNLLYDDVGWPVSKIKEIVINAGADMSLIRRLRDSGIIYAVGDNEFLLRDDITEQHLDIYLENAFSTDDAIFEYHNHVVPLRRQFYSFIESLTQSEVEDILSSIRDVWDIVDYSKHIMEDLYLDVLLPIIQQYGIADVPIFSSEGKKITQTGFSLAYFGEPGTGKTFATDDMIRGNERNGIPPHGIIGRIRYAEGMTPKKLIAILEAYQNYPVDWVIPEFNDFFRYKGMVEKLKLVMEQREVSDETKREVIKPYKVSSFFIVNYNTKVVNNRWSVTIEDPNFNAIEDRMICRIFVNDEKRESAIYRNMVRRISGDIEWYLSETLRKHVTYSYHYFTQNPVKVRLSTADFVNFGNEIREYRKKLGVSISNRIILKGIQIAGSAALIKGVGKTEEIKIGKRELSLALNFIKEEIETRARRV